MDADRASEARRPLLLAAFAAALALALSASGGAAALVAAAAALVAALALRPRADGVALFGSLALFLVLQAQVPDLAAAYDVRLRLEMATAILPFLLTVVLVRRARAEAEAPRTLLGLAVALAVLGVAARLLQAGLLLRTPGDAATLRYALRLDMAATLWALAALAVAFSVAGAALARSLRRRGRPVATTLAVVGFLLVSTGFPTVLGTAIAPLPRLAIGFHAEEVSHVPAGARVVHLEAAMPEVMPSPDEMRLAPIERALDEAAERRLDVYLLVSTYPPRWMIERYPEAVMTDADGVPFTWMDEAPGVARERIWDMSFSDPRVTAEKAAYVEAVVARVAGHPSVRWVAVQNEPAYPTDWNLLRWASFDEATVGAFRAALHVETDGDLERLNDGYRTRFESWEDVEPPRIPLGDLGERWLLFREEALVRHTTALMEAARDHTDKPVTTKLMAHFLTRFAGPQAGMGDRTYRALADASDVVSIDIYPATRADLRRHLDYFTELAAGKPLVVAEFNLALGARLPFAGLRMLSALQAMEGRVDAVILFTASGHHLYGIREDSSAAAATAVFHHPRDVGALAHFATREAQGLAATPGLAGDMMRTMRALQ